MHWASLWVAVSMLAGETETPDPDLVRAWLEVSRKHAEDYALFPAERPDRPFSMLPHAIFRHSQPVRGDDIGAVYLWVDGDGRPAVIGTTFAYTLEADLRAVVHEFHSLAAEPIAAEWRDHKPWRTTEPGLEFRPVTGAAKPSDNPKQRQRQARDIARRFGAESAERDEQRWQLRLISKPVHQFDGGSTAETLSGALFLFCQGTDPELILAIEARRTDQGPEWVYAAAPFTDLGLTLKLDDRDVWSAERNAFGPTKPHWAGTMSKERLPSADDANDR